MSSSLQQFVALLTHVVSIISDTYEFSLSAEQREIFDGWKRPSDLSANWPKSNGKTPSEPTMLPIEQMDLVQDVTTDCSVVASLCTGRSPCGPTYSKVQIGHWILFRIPLC